MCKLLFITFFCKCLNVGADLCKILVANNLIIQILNIVLKTNEMYHPKENFLTAI